MMGKHLVILKIISIIMISFVMLGCSTSEHYSLRLGSYISHQSYLKNVYYNYFHNTLLSTGDTLTLLDSNFFRYYHRSIDGYGKYTLKKDSLYLSYDSTFYQRTKKMDYVNYSGVYHIKDNNTLMQEYIVRACDDTTQRFKEMKELNYFK